MPTETIRILIVDDHAVVRKGLSMVLRLEEDFDVVGEAGSGQEALEAAKHLKPDLVLLDLMMPDMHGGQAARLLRQAQPDIKTLILTGTEVDSRVLRIMESGVDGYVLKEIEPEELKQAIRAVAGGEAYLHPAVTRLLLDSLQGNIPEAKTSNLTPRELEVLDWIATSKTYRQIATELNISEETIRSHVKSILHKLDQPNRAQAVLAALREGLIELPE